MKHQRLVKIKKMKKEAKLGKIKTPSLHSTETKPEKNTPMLPISKHPIID